MPYRGRLTPEQARAMGVPDNRWVISPVPRRMQKPAKPVEKQTDNETKEKDDGVPGLADS